jgi:glycine/D-amino acid oxidase-like deaminating enzyme
METADAVIIGGGIMGCSTAYYLAKLNFGKVVMLEKYLLASGSTGHSAAVVRQHYSNEVTMRLAMRAIELFSGFDEELGYPCGFDPVGYLVLAREEDCPAIRHVVELQQKLGGDGRMVGLDDIRELAPYADLHAIAGGCYEETSGYADPRATVFALAHRASELGVAVQQLTEVRSIQLRGGRVAGVVTNRGEISTPVVVNCSGPWAAKVGKMAGVDYSLQLSREYDVKFQLPALVGRFPVTSDPHHGSYYRPQRPGFAIAGRTYPKHIEPCDPDNYEDKARPSEVEGMSSRLLERMPRLKGILPVAGWAGIYSITQDWHPIVGDVPGLDGYFHFVGGSGHGFKIAPPIGEALADTIAGRQPRIDISPLHYSRFQEGKMLGSVWGPGTKA